jgi:hypothetical protein
MDRNRAIGNAVVPQVAEFIGRAIARVHGLEIPGEVPEGSVPLGRPPAEGR